MLFRSHTAARARQRPGRSTPRHQSQVFAKSPYFRGRYGAGYKNSRFYAYGIECYDVLSEFASYACKNNSTVDIRAVYSFVEHKKLMKLRLDFLSSFCGVRDVAAQYGVLVDKLNMLINMVIKANISRQPKIWTRIIDMLVDCRAEEIQALSEFLNLIQPKES